MSESSSRPPSRPPASSKGATTGTEKNQRSSKPSSPVLRSSASSKAFRMMRTSSSKPSGRRRRTGAEVLTKVLLSTLRSPYLSTSSFRHSLTSTVDEDMPMLLDSLADLSALSKLRNVGLHGTKSLVLGVTASARRPLTTDTADFSAVLTANIVRRGAAAGGCCDYSVGLVKLVRWRGAIPPEVFVGLLRRLSPLHDCLRLHYNVCTYSNSNRPASAVVEAVVCAVAGHQFDIYLVAHFNPAAVPVLIRYAERCGAVVPIFGTLETVATIVRHTTRHLSPAITVGENLLPFVSPKALTLGKRLDYEGARHAGERSSPISSFYVSKSSRHASSTKVPSFITGSKVEGSESPVLVLTTTHASSFKTRLAALLALRPPSEDEDALPPIELVRRVPLVSTFDGEKEKKEKRAEVVATASVTRLPTLRKAPGRAASLTTPITFASNFASSPPRFIPCGAALSFSSIFPHDENLNVMGLLDGTAGRMTQMVSLPDGSSAVLMPGTDGSPVVAHMSLDTRSSLVCWHRASMDGCPKRLHAPLMCAVPTKPGLLIIVDLKTSSTSSLEREQLVRAEKRLSRSSSALGLTPSSRGRGRSGMNNGVSVSMARLPSRRSGRSMSVRIQVWEVDMRPCFTAKRCASRSSTAPSSNDFRGPVWRSRAVPGQRELLPAVSSVTLSALHVTLDEHLVLISHVGSSGGRAVVWRCRVGEYQWRTGASLSVVPVLSWSQTALVRDEVLIVGSVDVASPVRVWIYRPAFDAILELGVGHAFMRRSAPLVSFYDGALLLDLAGPVGLLGISVVVASPSVLTTAARADAGATYSWGARAESGMVRALERLHDRATRDTDDFLVFDELAMVSVPYVEASGEDLETTSEGILDESESEEDATVTKLKPSQLLPGYSEIEPPPSNSSLRLPPAAWCLEVAALEAAPIKRPDWATACMMLKGGHPCVATIRSDGIFFADI